MKAVNVNDVLKIIYKYGKFVFFKDYPKYRKMQDEIANLPKVADNANVVLDKIRAEIDFIADSNGVKHIHRDDVHRIIDKYRKGDKK